MSKLLDELVAVMIASHDQQAINGSMVSQVWSDGESTLTKGGSLFGQRLLHQIKRPCLSLEQSEYISKKLLIALPNLEQFGGACSIMPSNCECGDIIVNLMRELGGK
jgi:hypothetical protein